MTITTPAATSAPTLQEQAPRLPAHVAGYVGHRTAAIGLRRGLLAALADAPGGITADELAERLALDPFYVAVWCRAALAAGLVDRCDGDERADLDGPYRLAPHVDTLLLDANHPAYVGGVFTVLEHRFVIRTSRSRTAATARAACPAG